MLAGFVLSLAGDADGDFHGAFEGGDHNSRLAGLIDIAQEENHQFIRNPVPGFANNIPGGTVADIAKLDVKLREMSHRPIVNKHWLAMFPDEHDRPARHTTQGDRPGSLVMQVEIVAVLG